MSKYLIVVVAFGLLLYAEHSLASGPSPPVPKVQAPMPRPRPAYIEEEREKLRGYLNDLRAQP